MRQITAQASFTDQPLDELRQWLAISSTRDDALLRDLLGAAHVMCERFTGVFPLKTRVAEDLAASTRWQALASRPVVALGRVDAIADDLSVRMLAASQYETRPAEGGAIEFRLAGNIAERRLRAELDTGLASTWSQLDEGLRHGIIRFAAHQYRERDRDAPEALPAAVAALWRPWRRLRL